MKQIKIFSHMSFPNAFIGNPLLLQCMPFPNAFIGNPSKKSNKKSFQPKAILKNLLITTLILITINTSNAFYDRQVYSGQELFDLGVNRPADIFNLLPMWRSTTIDGYTWWASASGLETFNSQGWVLLLDGQKLDYDVLGVQQLNNLPVDICRIDSVEVFNSPTLVEGIYATCGAIHFHTKKVKKRLDFSGSMVRGQETGDPGAFRYTTDHDTNVDKLGPDYLNYFGIRYNVFNAFYNNVVRDHFVTDSNILAENLYANKNVYPKIEYRGNYFGGGIETKTTSLQIQVHDYKVDDFFHFSPRNQEIPLENSFQQVGIVNRNKLKNGFLIFRFHLSRNYLDSDYQKNGYEAEIDWDIADVRANVEEVTIGKNFTNVLGVDIPAYRFIHAEYAPATRPAEVIQGSIYSEDDKTAERYRTRFYISHDQRYTKNTHQNFYLDYSPDLNKAITLSTHLVQKYSQTGTAKLKLYYFKRHYSQLRTAWYELNDFATVDPYVMSSIPTSQVFDNYSLEIAIDEKISENMAMNAQVFYRKFHNYPFSDEFSNNSEPSVFVYKTNQVSRGYDFALNMRTSKKWKHYLGFSSIFCTAAKDGHSHDDFPKSNEYKGVYSFQYYPGNNFSLSALFNYLSNSEWYFYNFGPEYFYREKIELREQYWLDLAIRKSLFKEKLNLRMIFRNPLNIKRQYQPYGSQFDFSVYFQANVNFSI